MVKKKLEDFKNIFFYLTESLNNFMKNSNPFKRYLEGLQILKRLKDN